MKEQILKMKGISKNFAGVRALKEVDFTLNKGEIHALIGENGAGKSTLMKILLGIYKMDGGTIFYKGEAVTFKDPHDALKRGISMVHQEISLMPSMTVSENVWLGREREFMHLGLISESRRHERTAELLKELGIDLKPSVIVKNLTVAQMQLVELVRAITYQPDILILDEPTSALSNNEIDLLFTIVRRIARQGTAVIFISHKLGEIFEICDRITVMRDGEYITSKLCSEIKMDELITLIAGREIAHEKRISRTQPLGEEMLRVESFSRTRCVP